MIMVGAKGRTIQLLRRSLKKREWVGDPGDGAILAPSGGTVTVTTIADGAVNAMGVNGCSTTGPGQVHGVTMIGVPCPIGGGSVGPNETDRGGAGPKTRTMKRGLAAME